MKIITVALAAIMLSVAVSAAAPSSGPDAEALYDRLTRELSCLCGCNQSVKACPHTACDSAIPTRNRIKELITQGKDHDEILSVLVKEKGQVILSKPKEEGFNLLGYILPSVAILVVGALVFRLIKGWTRSGQATAAQTAASKIPAAESADPLAERMKKELSEFED